MCQNYSQLLYDPGKNKRRPPISITVEKRIWREATYSCSIPGCRKPGVEVHHIIPWREALAKYNEAHYVQNLIALCPSCHSAADAGEITRDYLRAVKASLQSEIAFPENLFLNITSQEPTIRASFLYDLHDWHRHFIYKGKFHQYYDYLDQLFRKLQSERKLNSVEGLALLNSFASLLRRRSSKYFSKAEGFLTQAIGISSSLRKNTPIGPYMGRLKYDLAYIHFLKNDFNTAEALFRESEYNEKSLKNNTGYFISKALAEVVYNRKTGHYRTDQFQRYQDYFSEHNDPDSLRWVINCYIHLAALQIKKKKYDRAMDHIQIADKLYDASNIQTGRAKLLRLTGIIQLKSNEPAALKTLSASLAYHENLQLLEAKAETLYYYGLALEKENEIDCARKIYKESLKCDANMDNKKGITLCRLRLLKLK